MNTIIPGQTLTARSVGDYDCIFKLQVLSRTAKRCTFTEHGKVRTSKVHTDADGEFLMPDRYSMAPIFRAPAAPKNVIPFPIAA